MEALTRSEKACLTRAYYRFEVFCHLFCGSQYESFIGINVNEFFFSDLGLEPWEAQEMYCIYVFVKKYEAVVKDVKWDLDERNPRFDDEFEPELEGSAFPVDKEYDGKSLPLLLSSCIVIFYASPVRRSSLAAYVLFGTCAKLCARSCAVFSWAYSLITAGRTFERHHRARGSKSGSENDHG